MSGTKLRPDSSSCTIVSGFWTGSILKRIWSISVNMAVFAPMPSARERMAMPGRRGFSLRVRTAMPSELIADTIARRMPPNGPLITKHLRGIGFVSSSRNWDGGVSKRTPVN